MLKKTANWKSIKSCSTPLLQAWGWRAKTVLPWPELIGLSNATRIPVVSHADYIPGRNILSFNFINLLVSLVRGVSKAAALEEVRQSCQRRAVFHACGGRRRQRRRDAGLGRPRRCNGRRRPVGQAGRRRRHHRRRRRRPCPRPRTPAIEAAGYAFLQLSPQNTYLLYGSGSIY